MSLRASEQQDRRSPDLSTITTTSGGVNKANDANNSKVVQNDCKSKAKDIPSSDQSYSRLNKLRAKSIKEQSSRTNIQSINKLRPEERAVWHNSTLFSKTLSNIDGIRGAKTRGNASQTLSVTREYCGADLNRKNSDTNTVGMSPERTATTQTAQSSVTSAPAAKPSEWKLLKSKLSLLRKKGNKEMTGNSNDNPIMGRDIKEANSNVSPFMGKHEKLLVQSSIPTTESILTKKSWSQEKGIICKKEDLMHIISEAVKASKTKSINSDENDKQGLCASGICYPSTSSTSPTSAPEVSIKRNELKKQHSCGKESPCDRQHEQQNNKTKQSNARNECYDCCEPENSHKNQYNSNINTTNSGEKRNKEEKDEREELLVKEKEKVLQNSDQNQNECAIRLKDENIMKGIGCERIAINETNLANSETDNKRLNEEESGECSDGGAAVKWDDINLDPLLLGDAIQAFLQGLGSAGSSSVGNASSNEKRVSFKKSF